MVHEVSLDKWLVLACLLATLGCTGRALAGKQVVLASAGSSTVILTASNGPLVQRAALRLQQSILDRTGSKPMISASPAGYRSVIILGWPADPKLAALVGAKPGFSTAFDDAYVLRAIKGRRQDVVLVAGRTDAGTKYAVYELIRSARTRGAKLVVDETSVVRKPVFKNRMVILGIPMGQSLDPARQRKYCFENWDIPEIERYVDLLDFYGFNRIQISMTPARFSWTGNLINADQLVAKYKALCNHAHANGMTISLYYWGNVFFSLTSPSHEWLTYCPRDPVERAELLAHYDKWLALLGPLADDLTVHWVDAGGCSKNGCTIKEPQELTRILYDKATAVNPHMSVSMNLWMMQLDAWPGYKGIDTLLDSGILPKEVILTHTGARFEEPVARRIVEKGYRAAVWSWYFTDMETVNGLHYQGKIMDIDFDRLPDDVGSLLEWFAIDSVYHRMNLPTLYVGARKCWGLKPRSAEYLAEFTDAVFGPKVGPRVRSAITTLGDIRCGARTWETTPWFAMNAHNVTCALGSGTPNPRTDLDRINAALAKLKGLKADPAYKPAIPILTTPDEIIAMFDEHLVTMREFARLRLLVGDIELAHRTNAPADKQQQMIDQALNYPLPDPRVTFGSPEKDWQLPKIRERLEQIKAQVTGQPNQPGPSPKPQDQIIR